MIDQEARYLKSHEWAKKEDGEVFAVGLSSYAIEQLGDIVFMELPAVGDTFEQGAMFGVVESVKAASAIYTPVAGTIEKVNPDLESTPELINQKPYEAFIFAIRFDAASGAAQIKELLDAGSYKQHVEQEKSEH